MLSNRKLGQDWKYILEINCYVSPEGFHVVNQMIAEITDAQWLGHQHGDRNLYKKGCRGPMCRKAMRDYGRRYQRDRAGHVGVRRTKQQEFDPLVARYTLAHKGDFGRAQAQRERQLQHLKESIEARPKLGVG